MADPLTDFYLGKFEDEVKKEEEEVKEVEDVKEETQSSNSLSSEPKLDVEEGTDLVTETINEVAETEEDVALPLPTSPPDDVDVQDPILELTQICDTGDKYYIKLVIDDEEDKIEDVVKVIAVSNGIYDVRSSLVLGVIMRSEEGRKIMSVKLNGIELYINSNSQWAALVRYGKDDVVVKEFIIRPLISDSSKIPKTITTPKIYCRIGGFKQFLARYEMYTSDYEIISRYPIPVYRKGLFHLTYYVTIVVIDQSLYKKVSEEALEIIGTSFKLHERTFISECGLFEIIKLVKYNR